MMDPFDISQEGVCELELVTVASEQELVSIASKLELESS